MYACLHLSIERKKLKKKCCKINTRHKCKCVRTFELGDFHVFGSLHFIEAISVFIQEPVVILALGLMLFVQLVILLLQVLMLVLKEKKDCCHRMVCFVLSLYKNDYQTTTKNLQDKLECVSACVGIKLIHTFSI